MNHHGGHYGMDPGDKWVDLSKIGGDHGWGDRPLRELQDLALSEMERIDKECDRLNVVGVGPYYWITDSQGHLHLARDTAPVATVKIMGLEAVERAHAEAVRQEHSE